VPGYGETGRPPLRSGIGQDARQSARPAGPSSDLPLVTRFAISLADKAALSSLALGRPLLGLPLHNRHYANLSRVSQSTTMCRLHPSAPSKGAPPGAHHRKERAASSKRRTPAPTVSRLGARAAAAPRLPRLRSKPRDSVLRGGFEGLQPAGARFRPGDARKHRRTVPSAVTLLPVRSWRRWLAGVKAALRRRRTPALTPTRPPRPGITGRQLKEEKLLSLAARLER